jgi:hypothetical protein
MKKVDTISLSNRINLRVKYSDTASMLSPYLRKGDTSSLSNRINLKLNISDTAAMLSAYQTAINGRVKYTDTAAMLSGRFAKDTVSLSNRINQKGSVDSVTTGLGLSGGTIQKTGTISVDTSNASILSRQRAASTYALLSSLGSYLPLTGGTLTGALAGTTAGFTGAVNLATTSGSVGIGTTTPNKVGINKALTINGASATTSGLELSVGNVGPTYYNSFNGTNVNLINTATGYIRLGTSNSERLRITDVGKIYNLNAPSGDYGMEIFSNATVGAGYGLHVKAGTNTVDNAFLVENAAGTATLLKVRGDGAVTIPGALTLNSTISNGTYTYTLPSETGTLALVGGSGVGTVTSVAALTLGTTGTDLSSTVANGTTTPVITLNVPTASATNRGALSSTDWTIFNSKANALSGTINTIPKFNTISTIGNSNITDNGSLVSLNSISNVNSNLGILAGYPAGGPIKSLSIATGGSGYVDASYTVSLTSGQSLYAQVTLVVSGGIVTTATLLYEGSNYFAGQNIVIPNTSLGGTGSGCVITIVSVNSSNLRIQNSNGVYSTASSDVTLYHFNNGPLTNEPLGFLKWETGDASTGVAGIQGKFGAYNADGNVGGAYFTFETKTAGGAVTEKTRIASNGAIGIGATSLTGYSLRASKNVSGATTSYGFMNDGVIQSDVTANAYGYSTNLSTVAATFTNSNLIHYNASQSTIGLGSTVTNQYGFNAGSTLTGATNNYGFYGNIASGTGDWNLYMNGTASNYLAGRLMVNGAADDGSTALKVTGKGIFSDDINVNGVTVGHGNSNVNTNTSLGNTTLFTNSTGDQNTASGGQALYFNSTGSKNTGNGYNSLSNNSTGSYNAAFGTASLYNNTTGTYNTAIGYNADVASNNLTNATAIGNGSSVATSNTIQLGNTDVTDVKTNGSISMTKAGAKINILTGTNASAGTATLVAGTAVVSTTAVTANSIILLTAQSGVSTSVVKISARTPGTSFTILAAGLSDTAVIGWLIIN